MLAVAARVDELVEPADLSIVGMILVEELQVAVVKHLEELLPRHWIELFVRLAEVEAQDLCSLHHRGAPPAFLGPAADGVVIARALRLVVFGLLVLSRCLSHAESPAHLKEPQGRRPASTAGMFQTCATGALP